MFTVCRVPAWQAAHCIRGAALAATLIATAVIVIPVAHAQEALGFERAISLAEDRSRQLLAQQLAAASSREMAVSAAQLPDPMLRLGVNSLPVTGSDRFSLNRDFMTQRSVAVAQEITREEKRSARVLRFQRESEASQAEHLLVLANLQRDTAIAWLERFFQERLRRLLATQREETGLQIEAADTAYRSGQGSQADVFAARTAVAQIDDRLDQVEREVATAMTRLTRWVGDAARYPLGEPPRTDAIRIQAERLESQIAHHPYIVVTAKNEELALAEAEIARSNRLSDIGVELMYSKRGPGFPDMVSFNVAIPLQWNQKHRQDRELAAKLALADRARAQRDEAIRAYLAETEAMLHAWQTNRLRLRRYDTAFVPLAAERTRAALAAYRGASGSLAAVLAARRAEIDARIEYVDLELDTARLWAQLNFLIPVRHASATTDR